MRRALPFFFFLLLVNQGFAKEIHLFTPEGFQASDYNLQLGSAEPGDEFVFPSGRKMECKKFLGQGYTTRVYEVSVDGKILALRVPRSRELSRNSYYQEGKTVNFINHTLRGFERLRGQNVPVVTVHEGVPGQYALVDYVKTDFTLEEFFLEKKPLDHEEKFLARAKLLEFAKNTAHITAIGDFNFTQLAFDSENKRWVLLDWTDGIETMDLTPNSGEHLFGLEHKTKILSMNNSSWTKNLFNDLNKTVILARLEIPRCAKLYEEIAKQQNISVPGRKTD